MAYVIFAKSVFVFWGFFCFFLAKSSLGKKEVVIFILSKLKKSLDKLWEASQKASQSFWEVLGTAFGIYVFIFIDNPNTTPGSVTIFGISHQIWLYFESSLEVTYYLCVLLLFEPRNEISLKI